MARVIPARDSSFLVYCRVTLGGKFVGRETKVAAVE
jgi:hypothetical protein